VSTLKSSAENLTLNADGSNNDVIIQSNGSTLVTVDGATGNVGMGVASAYGAAAGRKILTVEGASTTTIELAVSGARKGYIYHDATNISLATEVSGGDVDLVPHSTGDVKIANGDLVFTTAGKGICLGVTTNTDANTLEDYEEGSWTPTYAPETGSFTTLTLVGATPGRYVKIGKQVTCWWYLGTAGANLTGASGDLYVSGLPFANETVGAGNWSTGIYSTKWGGDQPTIASIHSSESFIRLLYRASHNADLSAQQTTDMGTGGDSNYTRGWVTYNTA